ncbi:ABC transporter substrate-binding protein [Alteromonas sp. AMM-1]|uniref:ABC transporter substrate-binding protein n=1 Tax=Alteromonas sp. AMM-1 TaxID=3394233 RepID=UPI0039A73715
MRITVLISYLLLSILLPAARAADTLPVLRVGVLTYGTLNWELDIARQDNPEEVGYQLELVTLGSPQALTIALQGDAVDMIVGDWLWAAQQHINQREFYFYPYSTAAGTLVTASTLSNQSVRALAGKTLGVAGGKANKNWVLYRAFALKQYQFDIATQTQVKFAAPPMLNQLVQRGDIDAVLTFWHYAAMLDSTAFTSLVTMQEVLSSFGIHNDIPVLGWLFKREWGDQHSSLVNAFLSRSYAIRQTLNDQDDAWKNISSFTEKYPAAAHNALIKAYREGIPTQWGPATWQDMQTLFSVIKQYDDEQALTGQLHSIPTSIFWQNNVLETHE